MAETNSAANNANPTSCFKEAVCIDAGRIYDSCSDKDCLEDLQVFFSDSEQPIVDQAINIKCRKVELLNVYLDVESVAFNKGFYAVDITYFFLVKLLVYTAAMGQPTEVNGISTFSKKVILYGSEGNVKVFSSTDARGELPHYNTNMPTASVHVVDPICLACRLCEPMDCCCERPSCIPTAITQNIEGSFGNCIPQKVVYISIGLFTIVQLERSVQMMIPAYDFCIPDKECVAATTDDPCELFRRIKFPVDEFFPPKLSDLTCDD